MSGQLHAQVALLPGKGIFAAHWLGGCVGPRAGLDTEAKRKMPARAGNLYSGHHTD
jgi:hypothetical protein